LRDVIGFAGPQVEAAEPDLAQDWNWGGTSQAAAPTALAAARPGPPEGQKGVPFDVGPGFGWHLGDAFSGLRAARNAAGDAVRGITIVHLDTGYDPDHAALPERLDHERERNLVEGGNSAVDRTPAGVFADAWKFGAIG
jgi:hypothetical protein